MLKYICLALVILSIQTFDLGGIVDATTGSVTDAANTVADSVNQLAYEAANIVKTTGDTLQGMASQVVNKTKGELKNAEAVVNLAVDTVKNQVSNIIDTIDNLSAKMCQSQCTNFFNLPCFVMFRCNDKIKRFCLAVILPILIAIIVCCGCSIGIFNCSCFCRVLMIISGLSCLLWLIKRRSQKKEQAKVQTPQDNPETEERLRKNNH